MLKVFKFKVFIFLKKTIGADGQEKTVFMGGVMLVQLTTPLFLDFAKASSGQTAATVIAMIKLLKQRDFLLTFYTMFTHFHF